MEGTIARATSARATSAKAADARGPTAKSRPHVSAARRIEAALLEDISAGLLAPGERLDETRLAERFGTSRTPVREALSRLTAADVLVGGNGRGVCVAVYSREELAQMFEAMSEIEAVCAGLAAKRLTLLARAELEAAQRECHAAAEADDRGRYLKANEAFHAAIYRATQNRYVGDLAAEFRRRTGPFRARKFASQADLVESAKGHDALLETILSADSAAAQRGMMDHQRRASLAVLATQ